MQIIPKYIESYADWTPDKPLEEMTAEDWAQEVLGDDVQSLERCYRVGLRMLARMHQMARYRCPSAPIYGTYAMYGHGGSSCVGKTAQLGDYAGKRTKSYHAFVAKWPNGAKMPEWAQPIFGFVSSQPANRTIEARRGGDQPSRPGPAVRIVSD